jgi:hypothetical protein
MCVFVHACESMVVHRVVRQMRSKQWWIVLYFELYAFREVASYAVTR